MTHPRLRPATVDSDGNATSRITVMVTRTTSERRFLLKPTRVVKQVFGYCLFAAAEKYGAEIHAVSVLSNHVHFILTIDPDSLSDFNAWVNRHVAQCLIEHYGKHYPLRTLEAVWSKDPPHEVLLANKNAIMQELVYVMANPEAALLTRGYRKWPGLRSTPRDWVRDDSRCTLYKRPNLYFSKKGRAPEQVTARFTIPPAFNGMAPMDFVITLETLLNNEHQRLQSLNAGKKYLGAKAAMTVDPFDSPNNRRPRYNTNPTVACGGDSELLHESKKAIHAFRRAYRAAWREFKKFGTAIFPAGCFKMRTRFHMPQSEGCFDWCLLSPA